MLIHIENETTLLTDCSNCAFVVADDGAAQTETEAGVLGGSHGESKPFKRIFPRKGSLLTN